MHFCKAADNGFLGRQTNFEAFLNSRGEGGGKIKIVPQVYMKNKMKTVIIIIGGSFKFTIIGKMDQGINWPWPNYIYLKIAHICML